MPILNSIFTSKIILYFMSQQKIHTRRKLAYKKQNLEHNYVLQESCKTVRRWQISILLVRGDHCVEDCCYVFIQ